MNSSLDQQSAAFPAPGRYKAKNSCQVCQYTFIIFVGACFQQIKQLGETISSSIRTLPLSLPVYGEGGTTTLERLAIEEAQNEKNPPADAELRASSNPELDHAIDDGNISVKSTSKTLIPVSSNEGAAHDVDGLSLLLNEMKKQTRLLEMILLNQQREQSAKRITMATQSLRSLDITPHRVDKDQS